MAGFYPSEDLFINADFASAFEQIPSDEHDDYKNEEYGDTVIDLYQQSIFGSPQKERADGRPEVDGPRKNYGNLPEENRTGQPDCINLKGKRKIQKYLSKKESTQNQEGFEERTAAAKDDHYIPEMVNIGQAFPEELDSSDGSSRKKKGHVFISYSWNEKEVVTKLREMLKKEGVEVWIDDEKMSGSILSAVAEAIENAAVVLIFASESYKQSHFCQLEAKYTFLKEKEFIPLIVQKGYRPDGWLGLLLADRLYFDFSNPYEFEKPWKGLMKELKRIGRLCCRTMH